MSTFASTHASTLAATNVERIALPSGPSGTDATIQAMAKAAMGDFGASSPKIIALARKIIREARVPERDQQGEVVAIHNWVMAHLRYVRDPLWSEMITYPETLAFETSTGDCDDHVVLEAALLGAVGIPSRFVTFAFKNQTGMSHVAMQANVKGEWISLDPIVKTKPAGWEAPDATSVVRYGINTPTGTASKVFSLGNAAAGALVLFAVLLFFKFTRFKGH